MYKQIIMSNMLKGTSKNYFFQETNIVNKIQGINFY